MDHCAKCGYELGVGRYCTNCGHPVDAEPTWRTDTAERPRVAPATPPPDEPPPPAWTSPPPARFPLYADEADPAEQTMHAEPVAPPASHRRRPWGLWVAGAAVLLLVAMVGVLLVVGGDDPSSTVEEPASGATSDTGDGGDGGVGNLASAASVSVPATAGPGQDVDGKPVAYDGENMLDGVPETAWRMPGDGTGAEIVVSLAEKSRLRSVGLINGYAKSAADRDWYHGNRRIEQVEWAFDDGTTVTQELGDSTGVQSVDVDVSTTTVTLRLLAVSKPGSGPSARDFTAISDLSLVGTS